MARIRTLKPEILEDDKTAALTDRAWRLFVSLILLADDYGRLRAQPRYLDGAIFHSAPDSAPIETALEELERLSLVKRYEVRGQPYLAINNWAKHQKVDHPGQPRIPSPGEAFAKPSRDPRETLAPDLGPVPVPYCSEPAAEDGSDSKQPVLALVSDPVEVEEAAIALPLPGQQGEWKLSRAKLAQLAEAYPGIDPLAEARKARAWLLANPPKRKTARGLPRFLNSWFERAQNNGRGPGPTRPEPSGPPTFRSVADSSAPNGYRLEEVVS